MAPVLRATAKAPDRAVRDIASEVSAEFALTDMELDARLASGSSVFLNRVHWATTYLKKAGLIESSGRGRVKLTPQGHEVLATNPARIDRNFLLRYPSFERFLRPSDTDDAPRVPPGQQETAIETRTPKERIEAAATEINRDLADELLSKVKAATPEFFESLVLDLLREMGYGGSRKDASEHLGRTGDGGVDGVIRQDRLGLDAVYVQAKRWENTVGRPTVQAFAGSLDGVRARKGVLLTTSTFSAEARDYARGIEKRIVLIDGPELVTLMIEHGVGVSADATFVLKRLDGDYFDEA